MSYRRSNKSEIRALARRREQLRREVDARIAELTRPCDRKAAA